MNLEEAASVALALGVVALLIYLLIVLWRTRNF